MENRCATLCKYFFSASLMAAVAAISGCSRQPDPQWTPRAEVQEWQNDEETRPLHDLTVAALEENCGSWNEPKMLGEAGFDTDRLEKGRDVYSRYCQQCHGLTGDGKGPAAAILRPRPRDYRAGIFKFTSTPYGKKPLRSDLAQTVKRGVSGTSMPSFALLADDDLEAVIDYVLVLTHRGELENSLLLEAEFVLEEEGDSGEETRELQAEYVVDLIDGILEKWKEAEGASVYPLTPRPRFTAAHVERGYEAFLRVGCTKCHGVDGRGATEGEVRKDSWGDITKAADITSGLLHGGVQPIDIYRRIHSGINGTPMPNFSKSLSAEPETLWDLVAYVMYLAEVRRSGEVPPPIEIPAPGESVLEAKMELADNSREKTAADQPEEQ